MKSNLELLIDHVQNEVDYLQSSMDACIKELDFDGAKAFKEPLLYTKRKLHILRNLENPERVKISALNQKIRDLEKMLTKGTDPDNSGNRANYYLDKIISWKNEIALIQSANPNLRIDDDTILELLDLLKSDTIRQIQLDIIKDNLYLIISLENDVLELRFISTSRVKIRDYLNQPSKNILKELGFNIEKFVKQITDFSDVDTLQILEELSVIYFEVFRIFDKKDLEIIIE